MAKMAISIDVPIENEEEYGDVKKEIRKSAEEAMEDVAGAEIEGVTYKREIDHWNLDVPEGMQRSILEKQTPVILSKAELEIIYHHLMDAYSEDEWSDDAIWLTDGLLETLEMQGFAVIGAAQEFDPKK